MLLLETILRSGNDLILNRFAEFHKKCAETGYTDDQVTIILWMLLSIPQHLTIYNIKLELKSGMVEVRLNQRKELL